MAAAYADNQTDARAEVAAETILQMRHFHWGDVTAVNAKKVADLSGLPKVTLEDFRLYNVQAIGAKSGIRCENAKDVVLQDITLQPRSGPAVEARNVTNLEVRRLAVEKANDDSPDLERDGVTPTLRASAQNSNAGAKTNDGEVPRAPLDFIAMNNVHPIKARRAGWRLAGFCSLVICLLGCAAPAPTVKEGAPFTIVMLPDTQQYSRKHPELFMAQTEWVKENRDKENIVFVTQVGDIVNDRKKDTNQWLVAQEAMSVLDGVVPWGVTIGNHDFDSTACRPDQATAFLAQFGPQRFRGCSWYGGASTNGLNSYQLLSAGGIDFVFLHLELDVPDFAIEWAADVLRSHPSRAAIISTHSYLNGVSGTNGYNGAVSKYGNTGEAVWNKLVRRHPQIFLVLCGHHQRTVAYHQVSTNDAGARVVEILADYQRLHNGGDAWLRLLRFVPAQEEIQVRTYSPALKQFQTEPKHQFTVPLDLPACCRQTRTATLTP